MPRPTSSPPSGPLAALCAAYLLAVPACTGPREGPLGPLRGRTELIAEAEEKPPPPLAGPPGSAIRAFPLLFRERTPEREVLEVLWPLFETGRSGESSYHRARPFYFRDRFRGRDRLAVFPIFFRIREGSGEDARSIDHLWPLYGVHRERIDLVPTTTHHVLFPVFAFREGEGKWKVRLLPLAAVSSGFLDRGWWLIPVLKAGTGRGGWAGGDRFLYLLDPLFQYERSSIALPGEPEGPLDWRSSIRILGGLLGWERSGDGSSLRLLWLRV